MRRAGSDRGATSNRRSVVILGWFLSGVAVGVAYVLLAGIITIQIAAARGGAVINLNNEVIAVEPPSTPLVQWLASALLGALTFYLVSMKSRRRTAPIRAAISIGFIMSTLVLFVWSLSIADRAVPGTSSAATPLGWEGWLQEGGANPAVHLVMVLTIGTLALSHAPRAKASEHAAEEQRPSESRLQ